MGWKRLRQKNRVGALEGEGEFGFCLRESHRHRDLRVRNLNVILSRCPRRNGAIQNNATVKR